ncbi:MAG TPA: VOC family protein [Pantanalinema sp.]
MKFLHTRLKVRDLERAIAFYEANFGFEVRARQTTGRGSRLAHMHLPGGGPELELAYLPWDPDFSLAEDIFHIAFLVDSVLETVEAMRARGIKITEEPHRIGSGWMAFIEDPDGYEIELLDHTGPQ